MNPRPSPCAALRSGLVALTIFTPALLAQSEWSSRTPDTSPSARSSAGIAFDIARQRVVLFGGLGAAGYLDDTWEWDGATWTRRTPPNAPTPRASMAFAYDAARGVSVLHGGRDASGHRGDTWTWDGVDWQLAPTPLAAPQPRLWHSMAYDAARERIVLFGGFSEPSTYRPDTWEWDGSSWTQIIPSNQPLPRAHHAMAYDSHRERVVVMCGHRNGPRYQDRWEFDGTTWSLLEGSTPLGPRSDPALVFETSRDALVTFGGWEGGFRSDAWQWSSTSGWSALPTSSSPAERANAALCFDTARREVVMFGGLSAGSPLGDTWVYAPTGCTGEPRAQPRSTPSSTSAFDIDCGSPTAACAAPQVLLFGSCMPTPAALPAFLGCSKCVLAVGPAWGSMPERLGVAAGLPAGFEFCVQCACASMLTSGAPCVVLAAGTRIVVQ